MQTLKDLADEGRTVVCSIHQPRSSIFALFDDLLLLSEGHMVYNGPAEGSLQHFAAQACIAVLHPLVFPLFGKYNVYMPLIMSAGKHVL